MTTWQVLRDAGRMQPVRPRTGQRYPRQRAHPECGGGYRVSKHAGVAAAASCASQAGLSCLNDQICQISAW